jgi:long-chain acyl-CoA synthetase
MPNFIEDIFAQLKRADSRVVLREIHGEQFVSVSGRELLEQVQRVRAHLRRMGLQRGERCALLAPNSARWVAFNLALLAEGIIVVPLYARQSPVELAAMMKDCLPRFLFTSDAALGEAVAKLCRRTGRTRADWCSLTRYFKRAKRMRLRPTGRILAQTLTW